MHRTRALLIASLFVTALAHAAVDQPLHRTFNVAPGGTLTIDADVGDVRVSSGGNGVTVDVRRHARSEDELRDLDIHFSQSGNDVTVTAKNNHGTRWFSWGFGVNVEFIVTVPSRYNLHLGTAGGDVHISDVAGNVYARTSGGDLDLGRINGPVDARTSGGDVRLDGASGTVDLRTSGGSIRIGDAAGAVQARSSGGSIEARHVGGDLYAHTSGGSITVEDALGAIDADTSGGSIHARFSRQPQADSRLSTSGGGITVSVAGNVALDLDAHSSGGGVETDVPVTILGHQSEESVAGKINGGGPRLVLRSSGGGIHVKRM